MLPFPDQNFYASPVIILCIRVHIPVSIVATYVSIAALYVGIKLHKKEKLQQF